MDIALLASALTTFLAPALPFLLNLGGKAAEEAVTTMTADGWEAAKKIWGRLGPKVEAKPAALEAAEDVVAAPADDDTKTVLRQQLKKILTADEDLARAISELLPAGTVTTYHAVLHGDGAIAQGQGAVAAGKDGTAIGGSVHGNVTTGSFNRGDK